MAWCGVLESASIELRPEADDIGRDRQPDVGGRRAPAAGAPNHHRLLHAASAHRHQHRAHMAHPRTVVADVTGGARRRDATEWLVDSQ